MNSPEAREASFVDTLDDGTEVVFHKDAPNSYVAEIQHDARTCPGCPLCTGYAEPDEPNIEDGDESRFTRAQLDGEACTECGTDLAEGEPTVPSAYVPAEGHLRAHLRCVPDDEPMTNRDVMTENGAEAFTGTVTICDDFCDGSES